MISVFHWRHPVSGTSTPQFERSDFRSRRADRRCFRLFSFSYASSGVSESNTLMNRRFIFCSSLRMNLLEYFEISDPFGIYLRRLLFSCSIDGFSQGECSWQKYIVMPNTCSSRLCSRKRMSLSRVIVCISGYRLLMRTSARSTFRTDIGRIFSRRFFLTFLSRRPRTMPFPLFPETMKSPSK